jgi:parallel beta-helix repeat protein
MDEQRFDAALRSLGAATGRRQAIAGALGVLFGGGLLEAVAKGKGKGTGAGRERPGTEGPCGNGSRKANICTKDKDCCTGLCNTKAGKKNKDGKGRCRCVQKGKACKTSKNCCNGMKCSKGVCSGGGGGVPTGETCTKSDTCADSKATCTNYASWTDGPAGTYCLLPAEASCKVGKECTVNSCYRGACVACSCDACNRVNCATSTVTSGGDLQAAIDNASDGDVITIGPGTYTGDFVIPNGLSVTLAGCGSGSDEVILKNANYGSRTISLNSGSAANLDLIDIVVRGHNDVDDFKYGGGIGFLGALSLCARTRVEDGFWSGRGGGVQTEGTSSERGVLNVLDHTVIQNNMASDSGAGISADDYTDGLIGGLVKILDNATDAGSGGGVWAEPTATLTIGGNVLIKGNAAEFYGGGVGIYPNTALQAETERLTIGGNVVIDDNTSDSYGGGVAIAFEGSAGGFDLLTIKDNVQITNNTNTNWGGGGVYAAQAHLVIRDKVKITGNTADGRSQKLGGGIHMAIFNNPGTSVCEISGDVEISGNTATDKGGGIYLYKADMTVSDNVAITDNVASVKGGGVYLDTSPISFDLTGNATITGNTANGGSGSGGGIYSDSSSIDVTTVSGSVSGNTPENCAGNANGGLLTC